MTYFFAIDDLRIPDLLISGNKNTPRQSGCQVESFQTTKQGNEKGKTRNEPSPRGYDGSERFSSMSISPATTSVM